MRDQQVLFEIRDTTINQLGRADCQGCMYNHGSQKYHMICLTGVDGEYYYKEALIYMQNEKLIDIEEYHFLEKIRYSIYN